MSTATHGQRNPYRGVPERAWLKLRFIAKNGVAEDLVLIADSGSPHALIVSVDFMHSFKHREAADSFSHFGLLEGGWLQLDSPDLGYNFKQRAYASNSNAKMTASSDAQFSGLIGLPLLRLTDSGGDASAFWAKPASVPVLPS